MKVLLVPLFATFDALLGAMGGDVGQCLPNTSLGRAKHDYLIVGGALGGEAAWLLECVPEEDPTSALPWALYDALGAARPHYPSELGGELRARCADPAAIAGPGKRN
jgi:hypothetical protein